MDEEHQATLIARLSIGLLAIGLNIYVIIIIRMKQSTTMPSALLLLSLAFADLLHGIVTVVGGTLTVVGTRYVMHAAVRAALSISAALAFMSSILHVAAITMDRLFAITRPLRYRRVMTKSFIRVGILIMWIVSSGVSLTVLLGITYPVADFCIPISIYMSSMFIIFSYAHIIRVAKSSDDWRRQQYSLNNQKERRTELICGTVVFSFLLLNLPFAVGDTLSIAGVPFFGIRGIRFMFLLVLFNAVCNPLFYAILSRYKKRQSTQRRVKAMNLVRRKPSAKVSSST